MDRALALDLLFRINRILTRQRRQKHKLYALHAPEVGRISKGKAGTPYGFDEADGGHHHAQGMM